MRDPRFIAPLVLVLAACTLGWVSSGSAQAGISGQLSVYSPNKHYFVNNGTPVVIMGVGQPLPGRKSADYRADIDQIAAHKSNYLRFWIMPVWEAPNVYMPWARDGGGTAKDGAPKYNLTHWDNNFWNQLKDACAYAQSKNIYASIHIFDECGMEAGTDRWDKHPFQPSNNVNNVGLSSSSGVTSFYNLNNSTLKSLQEQFVAKLIQETSGYPNVIYEICNEYTGSWDWEVYWVNYISARCSNIISVNRLGNNSPSGYWSNSDIDMVKFHWSTTSTSSTNSYMNSYYSRNKAVNYDETPEIEGITYLDCRGMVWASFTGGGHVHLESGGNQAGSLDAILGIINFFEAVSPRFWEMSPNNSLVTSTPGGSAYTLAKPGSEYITYIKGSGSGSMNINLTSGYTYTAKAYNPKTYAFTNLRVSGNTVSGIPSYSEDIVIYIKADGATPPPTTSDPSMSLTISADKSKVVSGDTVVYTISFKNTGSGDAKNVTLTSPLPQNTTWVSGGTYNSAARSIKWNFSTINAGGTGSVSYTVSIN